MAAVSQQPGAQEPPVPGGEDVTVVLEGRLRSQFRLAIPEFDGLALLGPELRRAADEIDRTLRSDLEASRVFRLQGPEDLSVLALTGDLTRDFELYRSLQNELVLQVDLRPEGDKVVIEGRLYHLESGDSILGKRYRGTPAVARRIAHTFADEIILALSGRQGVALSQIAFYSDRSGFKEIYLMDYDGANQRPVTAHKSISLTPDWSRAGDTIAYVSYFSGAPGIYLVDLASGRKHRSSPRVRSTSRPPSPRWTQNRFWSFHGGRQHRDLRRQPGRNGLETADALFRYRYQPRLEPVGERDRLHLQPGRQPQYLSSWTPRAPICAG